MKFVPANRITSLSLLAALCLCFSTASEAAKRALLIGNNAYLHARPLVNARNDAVRLGEVLNGLGWQTTVLQDLTSDRMKRALREFKATLREGDEVVFHFSGHGAEFEQSSFLLPVDVEPTNRELVKDDAIRLRRVMDDFEQQRVRFSFLVIDACRDDPFAKGGDGSISPESGGAGSLVLYAARAKEVALDRLSSTDRDPNGVLTRVLLQEIVKRGVTLSAVAKQTQRRVHELARSVGKTQLPNISDTLLGEYYFLAADGSVATLNVERRPEPRPERPFTPAAPRRGEASKECTDCPDTVMAPEGRLTMGSSNSETGRNNVEGPQQQSSVDRVPAASALVVDAEIRPGNAIDREGIAWSWPTTGKVASKFSDKAPMKGIDIAANAGSQVVAAAIGKVIHVGKEPRGYGQMIVISHAKETVSVYFHVDKVLVKEQQRVLLGQRLAEVSDSAGNKMHFEVRRLGRPVDPLTLMPR
jgi:murein DD-endopeptidase MepM/ murein hydrolase activator NlpD